MVKKFRPKFFLMEVVNLQYSTGCPTHSNYYTSRVKGELIICLTAFTWAFRAITNDVNNAHSEPFGFKSFQ